MISSLAAHAIYPIKLKRSQILKYGNDKSIIKYLYHVDPNKYKIINDDYKCAREKRNLHRFMGPMDY